MIAKIRLTVGDRTYQPGDKIAGKLSPSDKRFLLREGYIEEETAGDSLKKPAGDRKAVSPSAEPVPKEDKKEK